METKSRARITRAMRRIGFALIALAALVASPAAARSGSIHVKPAKVRPGHVTRLSGYAGGCQRGNQVTLISRAFRHKREFAGVPAVFTRVGRRGRFSIRVRIPAHRRSAHYGVAGRCGGGGFAHATLTVTR
jgi:hypothetical protein